MLRKIVSAAMDDLNVIPVDIRIMRFPAPYNCERDFRLKRDEDKALS